MQLFALWFAEITSAFEATVYDFQYTGDLKQSVAQVSGTNRTRWYTVHWPLRSATVLRCTRVLALHSAHL